MKNLAFLGEFIRKTLKNDLSEHYAIIADEVNDQFSNKEFLLSWLRYVTYENGLLIIHRLFFDFLQINGCPIEQTVGKNILSLLEKSKIDIEKCRVQAYDSANVMSGNSSGAPSVI